MSGKIVTRPATQEYRDNWDATFGTARPGKVDVAAATAELEAEAKRLAERIDSATKENT